jgi:hypothetical protein
MHPTEQLQSDDWVGPFTTWHEYGLMIQVIPPSIPDTTVGSGSVLLPGRHITTRQSPEDKASTPQPKPSPADAAPDGRDQEATQDVSAPTAGPDIPAPSIAAVDGSTPTDEQVDGDTGDQTVVSDRCQEWQPRPGDELRPCMGGPQFVP